MKLEQLSPEYIVGYFGNVFVRIHRLTKKGDIGQSHKHEFDHMSIVTRGAVRVHFENGTSYDIGEGGFFPVPKDQKHYVEALEDDSRLWCVFALRDEEGNVADADAAHEYYQGDLTKSAMTRSPDPSA